MSNWVIDNFGVKGLSILVGGIILLVALIFGPSLYKKAKVLKYDGSAKAQITNITEKKMSFQDMSGGSVKTIGYDLTYTFAVDTVYYSRTETIKPSYDLVKLYKKFNLGQPCFVEVVYLTENPNKSLISRLLP